MRSCTTFVLGISFILLSSGISRAEIQVVTQQNADETATPEFKFANVPAPSRNDAATAARLAIMDGRSDPNGGDIGTLCDGRVPSDEDQPSENFFFGAGTDGGRILVDLGAVTEIRKVNTYSWHASTRGPQVYQLYAADGNADDFNLQPKQGTDPEKCGWKRVADVDTRSQDGKGGGQYGVSISESGGVLGKYRYLLFDVSRTEATDPFGNTFYSEIDVDDGTVHRAAAPPASEPRREIVEAEGGTYQITIDTTETPDLTQWAHEESAPVVQQWYPKIVNMLASEGYEAPGIVAITFGARMRGVAATGGTRSTVRRGLDEAKPPGRSQGRDRTRAGTCGAAIQPCAAARSRHRPDTRLACGRDCRLHSLVPVRTGDARCRNDGQKCCTCTIRCELSREREFSQLGHTDLRQADRRQAECGRSRGPLQRGSVERTHRPHRAGVGRRVESSVGAKAR